jgi:hypothetical protein
MKIKASRFLNANETKNSFNKKTKQDFNVEKPNLKDLNQIADSPEENTEAVKEFNKKHT